MQFVFILSSISAQVINLSFFQVKLCEYKATERDHEISWPLLTWALQIISFKLRNYTIPAVQMSDRNKGLEEFHLAEL